jgi:cytochrome c551/c552
MRLDHWVFIVLLGGFTLAGCGGGQSDKASAGAAGVSASGSKYDAGPRAAEAALDHTLAAKGEQLFKDKGCSACHAFGARMSGPDLAGVAMRRTAQWLEQQMLHPEVMAKEDPIARQMIAEFALQMPNQGLQPEEARAIVEFLKSRERVEDQGHTD